MSISLDDLFIGILRGEPAPLRLQAVSFSCAMPVPWPERRRIHILNVADRALTVTRVALGRYRLLDTEL